MGYVFGKNTTVGSSTDYNADEIIGCLYTNNGGAATIRSLYMYGIVEVSDDARLAIYDAFGPPNLLGETGPLPDATGWTGADLLSAVAVNDATTYFLVLHCGTVTRLVGNSIDSNEIRDATGETWSGGAPDPFPADEDNYGSRSLNIYADDEWINPPESDGGAAMLAAVL